LSAKRSNVKPYLYLSRLDPDLKEKIEAIRHSYGDISYAAVGRIILRLFFDGKSCHDLK